MKEQVILVDADDNAIGVGEKLQVHREGKLHRAFSVFVFNRAGQWLLQQRAPGKYHSPGCWSNACCSHPRPGEGLCEAARRRLQEELGFSCTVEPQFHFIYQAEMEGGLIEHELDHVLTAVYEGEIVPNASEVAAYRWLEWQTLQQELQQQPERFTVWFRLIASRVRSVQQQAV